MKQDEPGENNAQFRQNLQTLINTRKKCWICSRRDHLTDHHVIRQKLVADMNATIPLCTNCAEIIHKEHEFFGILRRLTK